MVVKIRPFWSKMNKGILTVTKTEKKFLRGVHRGEPIWEVKKGDEKLIVRQEEALEWQRIIENNPQFVQPQEENKNVL